MRKRWKGRYLNLRFHRVMTRARPKDLMAKGTTGVSGDWIHCPVSYVAIPDDKTWDGKESKDHSLP